MADSAKRLRLPILMYHEVSRESERRKAVRKTNPAYSVSAGEFGDQIRWLRDHGVETVSLSRVLEEDDPACGGKVAITFDDGWQNNYTEAFPLLREHAMEATLFLLTGFVGRQGYVDWAQAAEMEAGGVSVQSHTVSHRPLVGLGPAEIVSELEGSKKSIEDHLGKRVDLLSVPHGLLDRRVIDIAGRAGYRGICTTLPIVFHSLGNPAVLGRINVPDRCSLSVFAKIVGGDPSLLFRLRLEKEAKNALKKLLGYENYRKMYKLRYKIGE